MAISRLSGRSRHHRIQFSDAILALLRSAVRMIVAVTCGGQFETTMK
jgi:hypothetical protein